MTGAWFLPASRLQQGGGRNFAPVMAVGQFAIERQRLLERAETCRVTGLDIHPVDRKGLAPVAHRGPALTEIGLGTARPLRESHPNRIAACAGERRFRRSRPLFQRRRTWLRTGERRQKGDATYRDDALGTVHGPWRCQPVREAGMTVTPCSGQQLPRSEPGAFV